MRVDDIEFQKLHRLAQRLEREQQMISPEYVQLNLDCKDADEAIEKMAQVFLKDHVVKPTYVQAVLEREKVYPTGLPSEPFAIAIPHAMAEHSNRAAVTVGVLKNPVQFHQMGAPEIVLDAQILFMLAVSEPKAQIELLKSMMGLIQKEENLLAIKNAQTQQDVAQLLNENLVFEG